MKKPPAVALEHVSKTYRSGRLSVPVLHDVSLRVDSREFVSIMGPSGSGKSTLMNLVGALDTPTAGRVLIDGVDISHLGADELADVRGRRLGFVFQKFNLVGSLSAYENVELPLLYSRAHLSAREQRRRAHEALTLVGLSDREDHLPNQLSGGQQQRVAIARALVNEPKLLLADEPTGNLDSRTSVEIMGIFQELNGRGMTVVMVTHEFDIARYATRTIVMRDGRVVHDTPVSARATATDELRRIDEEQKAIQLT